MSFVFLSVWRFYVIRCDGNVHVNVFTHSRCGRRVDYRFYNHLEQILGQEAVSIDEYDERDEQVDQDPGRVLFIHSVHININNKCSVQRLSFVN